MARDKADIIKAICNGVDGGDDATVAAALREYPFVPQVNSGRNYTELQATRIFVRDGFVDRYSGARLIHPAVLRVLSKFLPRDFPFHPNWKMTDTHPAYSAKANWTLEELGWKLLPPGDFSRWDGLTGWLIRHIEKHGLENQERYVVQWYKAACKVTVITA
jgi:hypothetical protein